MRSSLAGTFTGWIAVGLAAVLAPHPLVILFALVLASSFTLLLLSHLAVFAVRVGSALRELTERGEGVEGTRLARRDFLLTVGRITVGGLVAAVLGSTIRVRAAHADPDTCEDPKKHAPATPPTIGPVNVCAGNAQSARERAGADPSVLARISQAAQGFCSTFTDCGTEDPATNCREVGGHKVEWTCAENRNVVCPGGQKGFTCTGQLTMVMCRCKKPPPPPKCAGAHVVPHGEPGSTFASGVVCAKNASDAKAAAGKDPTAVAAAAAFGDAFCANFTLDCGPKTCQRKPGDPGFAFEIEECTEVVGRCTGVDERPFVCTGRVTKVVCECK